MSTDAMSLTEVEPLLNPLTPVTYRVVARRVETGDVVTLSLEPTSGSSPLSFRPGQFNMLTSFGVAHSGYLPGGRQACRDRRRRHPVARADVGLEPALVPAGPIQHVDVVRGR